MRHGSKHLGATLLAACGALFATYAMAQMNPPPPSTPKPPMSSSTQSSGDPGTLMQRLDANKDGYIEKSEAAKDPALSKVFDKADANHDGKLDRIELAAATKMTK